MTPRDFSKVLRYEACITGEFKKMEFLNSKIFQVLASSKEGAIFESQDMNRLFIDQITDENADSVINSKVQLIKELIDAKAGHDVTGEELMTVFPLRLIELSSTRRRIKRSLDDAFGSDIYLKLIKANPTILIVEDEPVFRDSLSDYLGRFSENIITAESSYEAMEKVDAIESLDIKILDIDLPGEKGVDLLPKLNEKFPDSQTIMVTAYDDFDYVTKSFDNNVFDYILKPIDLQILVNKISRAIQIKGLKKLMATLSVSVFESMCKQERLSIMNELVRQQLDMGLPILFEDIVLLFPECNVEEIRSDQEITKEILDDGIGLLVSAILYQVANDAEFQIIFDDWRQFVSGLG